MNLAKPRIEGKEIEKHDPIFQYSKARKFNSWINLSEFKICFIFTEELKIRDGTIRQKADFNHWLAHVTCKYVQNSLPALKQTKKHSFKY